MTTLLADACVLLSVALAAVVIRGLVEKWTRKIGGPR